MKQKAIFLFFCMIFAANIVAAQQNQHPVRVSAQYSLYKSFYNLSPFPHNNVLPANFYCSRLGFFCRQEIRFEAATRIPFKFRLGSVQYCDWMEGKYHTASPRPW
jgi:hypothetical protein